MAEAPHQQLHKETKIALSDPGRWNRTPHDPSWELDTGRLQQLVVNSEVGDGE